MRTVVLHAADLERAADFIRAGQLVAFPTETVYGLGADVFQPEAIHTLFQVKGRPSDNPLIVHVSSLEQVAELACEIPPLFYHVAALFWPGPLTCVLKRRRSIPDIVSAGLDSIAVRMPSHPLALRLIQLARTPLVGPSANRSGKPSPTRVQHVLADFEGRIAAVIDGGEAEWGIESTVLSLMGEKPILLRPGSITQEDLEIALGYPICSAQPGSREAAASPGMKYRHYAPRCPLILIESLAELIDRLRVPLPSGKRMVLSHEKLDLACPSVDFYPLAAKTLYALLRQSDEEGCAEIVVLCDTHLHKDAALMNRLMKAAETETKRSSH